MQNKKRKKGIEVFPLIINLVLSIVAFSFLISLSEIEIVDGKPPSNSPTISQMEYFAQTGIKPVSASVSNTITLTKDMTDQLTGKDWSQYIGEKLLFTQEYVNGKLITNLGKGSLTADEAASYGKILGVDLSPLELAQKDALLSASNLISSYSAGMEIGHGLVVESVATKEGITTLKLSNGQTISGESGKALNEFAKLETTPTTYPKPLGLDLGFGWGHIAQGALWAVAVYSGVQMIGSFLGLKPETTSALANAAAGGLFIGKAAYGVFGEGGLAGTSLPGGLIGAAGIGIVVGLIILELTYSKTSQRIVTFECKPWEAPSGGASCEKCNSDLYPCTEYRCKSLGQNCEFKAGEGDVCVWKDPKDVNSPIIETMLDALTKDHIYNPKAIMPPQIGARIEYTKATDKCVKAFSPLTFGIKTNEPAQCKIDINSNKSAKLDSMQYYFGGSNLYSYNHTQTLRLPGPDSINAEAPELKANGIYNLYIKCKDANGNENAVPFVFNFCVEKGPDVTPPIIEGTSIANNMPVQSGLTETNLEVYINEPSECKWSKLDLSFKNMENQMVCSSHIYEMNNLMLYKCTTKLTGLIDNKDNEFFFKCIDQPLLKGTDKENDRREMQQSYKFTLKGTLPLNIISVNPKNDTIKGSGNTVELYLELETDNGYNNGDSWCSYSITGNEKDYILMYETGTNKHKQRLDLPAGEYKYYFQCVDLGGNSDKVSTTFKVDIDTQAPVVVRVYQDGSKLKIITDEKSTCSYQNNKERKCNFKIEEGTSMTYANSTEHFSEFKQGKTYYIKCQDVNARQPNPVDCSIIVKREN